MFRVSRPKGPNDDNEDNDDDDDDDDDDDYTFSIGLQTLMNVQALKQMSDLGLSFFTIESRLGFRGRIKWNLIRLILFGTAIERCMKRA